MHGLQSEISNYSDERNWMSFGDGVKISIYGIYS
jgi:hypothetical protein